VVSDQFGLHGRTQKLHGHVFKMREATVCEELRDADMPAHEVQDAALVLERGTADTERDTRLLHRAFALLPIISQHDGPPYLRLYGS
jgi:hypothetical protein